MQKRLKDRHVWLQRTYNELMRLVPPIDMPTENGEAEFETDYSVAERVADRLEVTISQAKVLVDDVALLGYLAVVQNLGQGKVRRRLVVDFDKEFGPEDVEKVRAIRRGERPSPPPPPDPPDDPPADPPPPGAPGSEGEDPEPAPPADPPDEPPAQAEIINHAELEATMGTLLTQLDSYLERAETAEARNTQLESELETANDQLETAQARVAELARRVEELESAQVPVVVMVPPGLARHLPNKQ